jgi:hypothetical protein
MSRTPIHEFACDLDPRTRFPRMRFNFANGWSGSLVVRAGQDGMHAMIASVAACPTGEWGTGHTELGPTEAFADEAIAWLHEVSRR